MFSYKNCYFCRQLIYNYPEQLFADAGVMAIEHADFDGIERLALVTGGEIVSTFDNPDLVKLGHCDVIEQVRCFYILLLIFFLSMNFGGKFLLNSKMLSFLTYFYIACQYKN